MPGIPDMWDPPERVGILRPDALIPAYIEHEHCELHIRVVTSTRAM